MKKLEDISVTGKDTALVVSGHGLFKKDKKEPYGFLIKIITKEKDADGIHCLMDVFLPYDAEPLTALHDAVMNSPVFIAEIRFENLEIISKKSGGYFATATGFEIIE